MKFEPIIPFEPLKTEEIPIGDSWVYQVKWDGVRILTYYDGDKINLFNRKLNNRNLQFPELTKVNNYCDAKSIILDGEVIAFVDGVPSFQEVMKRDSLRSKNSIELIRYQIPIYYMIFDILFLNDEWVVNKPLFQRQEILNNIINQNEYVQVINNFQDGPELFKAIREKGMEGIICKDFNSTYLINGKDKRWLKKKNYLDIVGIICGVSIKDNIVNSLLIGLFNNNKELRYIGNVGTGKLTNNEWKELTKTIKPLVIDQMPFSESPNRIDKDTLWVTPKLTVKIKFMEWTTNNTMRQPTIQSFVEKPINECDFEQ